MSARYITTTLPYVNASPHVGFALEAVQADVLARYWRAAGDDVFFSMGSDEHGQKIFEAAEKAGQRVQDYVDHYAAEFKKLKQILNLSNDAFVRTSSPAHVAAAQEMWRRCEAKGDIYKKSYIGLYCIGCEAFKTEKEIVEGHCIIHTNLVLQEITEENYFFKFSNYQGQLLEYLERPGVILPEWRREEALAFVKGGLEDFSISREKKRLSWGIPVPGDDSQVMYVWFDALTSYLSTLGWPSDSEGTFRKFWKEGKTLQLAGKDQVRFQSLIWQAMLMSAGVKKTDQVFYHGFINSGGQKMSKSLGNVINPYDLVKKYGTDAVRYILLRHVSPAEDSDLTLEAIADHYTAHLTNGLGNLVARVMKLCEDNLDAPIDAPQGASGASGVSAALTHFAFNKALDEIFSLVTAADERITKDEPFKVVKADPVRGKVMLSELATEVWNIGSLLAPFMPTTSEKIIQAVKDNKKPENLFPRI
jgi:methionyl-tRNA synthetase